MDNLYYTRNQRYKMDVCRTCLRTAETLLPLHEDFKLVKKIETISSIEITFEDWLPDKVCSQCIVNISLSYNFRRVILNSDKALRNRYEKQNVESNSNVLKDSSLIFNVKREESNCDYLDLCLDTLLNNDATALTQETDTEQKELQQTDLDQTEFQKTELEQNELQKTDPEQYELQETDLKQDGFQNIDSEQYDLQETDVEENELQETDLEQNELQEIDLERNELQEADSKQYELQEMDLEQIEFQKIYLEQNKLQEVTEKKVVKKKRLRKCNTCEFESYNTNKYHQHLQNHIKRVCTICGKLLVVTNMNKHIARHSYAPIPCEVCGKVFRNKESLRFHLRIHNEKVRKCKICGKEWKKRLEYLRHLKTHKCKNCTIKKYNNLGNEPNQFYPCRLKVDLMELK